MLTCIACSKQLGGGSSLHDPPDDDEFGGAAASAGGATTPSTRQAVKALTAQIRDMAVKASGAYRHCKPCAGSANHRRYAAESESDRFYSCAYKRAGGTSGVSTPRLIGGLGLGLGGGAAVSSGEATPSMSCRTESEAATLPEFLEGEEEGEGKEWVAQVEPGVLITFVVLPRGGNDLKRIRFSREMFDKWQAQRWWAENYDKVMELYNVHRFNRHSVPFPTAPPDHDQDQSSKEDSPVTPPLGKERLPRNFHRPVPSSNGGLGSSSSDSLDHKHHHGRSNHLMPTPKISSISGARTSADPSVSSSHGGEEEEGGDEEETETEMSVSVSNASDQEREWVEEDEPGVYITIRELPGGVRELRRVRFSRERFTEMHARLWWEENRARIHDQYL